MLKSFLHIMVMRLDTICSVSYIFRPFLLGSKISGGWTYLCI
uniref:Uncharacterized protein n=1 Tax=Arundo donax TaxID=35708 RepID=A0A0A8ZQR5_ARUDO